MNASLCRHLKSSGTPCKSRALANASYCRTHEHLHEGRMSLRANDSTKDVQSAEIIKLDAIEDSASVQRALSVVITAVAAGTLDAARARVLLLLHSADALVGYSVTSEADTHAPLPLSSLVAHAAARRRVLRKTNLGSPSKGERNGRKHPTNHSS